MLTLPKHNRYEYSVIGERKDYSWPGGKRLAFYVALNIEHFAFGATYQVTGRSLLLFRLARESNRKMEGNGQ